MRQIRQQNMQTPEKKSVHSKSKIGIQWWRIQRSYREQSKINKTIEKKKFQKRKQ